MLLKTIARKTLNLKNHKIDRIKETPEGKIEIHISNIKRRLLPCKNHDKKYKVVDHLQKGSSGNLVIQDMKYDKLWYG